MKVWLIPGCILTLSLSACQSNPPTCEEILEVKQQQKQCEEWRQIMSRSDYPQQALTARKNYEQACENLRYYRDDYDTICKANEKPIGKKAPEKSEK